MTEREFTEFFNTYYKYYVSYSYKITNSIQDSENVVQEVFVELYNSGKLDGLALSQRGKYGYATVKHRSINFLVWKNQKGRSGEIKCEDIDKKFFNIADVKISMYDEIIMLAAKYIDELAPRQREVMYMHYFKGLHSGKIAKVLNIGVSSVKKSIARGKETLIARMSPEIKGMIDVR